MANSTPTPSSISIIDIFDKVVSDSGSSIALQELDNRGTLTRTISYGELDSLSDGIALRLQQTGVEPGDRVALEADKCTASICTIIALLKLGAIYVPVDRSYPKERISFIINDCQIRLLINFSDDFPKLKDTEVTTLHVVLEDFQERPKGELNRASTTAEDSLYVMYTSGSTGRPKGVEIRHKGVIRLVSPENSYYPFDASTSFLQLAPLTFDASTLEIWGSLLNGGCCCLYPFSDFPDPKIIIHILQSKNINSLWLTASFFNWLVDTEDLSGINLKNLLIGGEALSVDHVRKAQLMLPNTQITNGYGPTETTTFACCYPIPNPVPADWKSIPIGFPIHKTDIFILDENYQQVADGQPGQLFVGGEGLAKEYVNLPDQTGEKFVDLELQERSMRLYATGDIVTQQDNGTIDYIGRKDDQVKLAGHRIELGEVNHAILRHDAIKQAYTTVIQQPPNERRLVSYVVSTNEALDAGQLRLYLRDTMPDYMIPSEFVFLDELPLNQNGKIDRKALPSLRLKYHHVKSQDIDEILRDLWQSTLNLDSIKDDANFFESGGTSLLYMAMVTRAKQEYHIEIGAVDIFEQPTFGKFKTLIKSRNIVAEEILQKFSGTKAPRQLHNCPIAIIGMSGRFPGANSPLEFWKNLESGVESITDFDISQLAPSEQQLARDNDSYVYARGVLDQFDCFDAEFFDVSAREAAATDPQQRLFLEESWKALESAGYYPGEDNMIGLFAGSGCNRYYLTNLYPQYGIDGPLGDLPTQFVNDKDYLATRTAFKLNLQGPCLSINTACSTSLVTVVEAVKSLRTNGCDLALAGGISLQTPMNSGYLYLEGGMLSPDGSTRPFSKSSSGTSFNSGVAIIVLKRLQDAERDGDYIHAVIHGAASNNDGTDKASFTAPSINGQSKVIDAALKDAGFSADSIDFVETHGTATPLGDPIEIEALDRAFDKNNNSNRSLPCWIGSVKSNVGHLVSAAGTAGLIKTALALSKRILPATLHFDAPSPNINFKALPFKVCDKAYPFPDSDKPLRAGVSSFGVGGTNAHVILQEYKARAVTRCEQQPRLFVLSAKSEEALANYTRKMAAAVKKMDAQQLRDTAYTLQMSRSFLPYRFATVTDNAEKLKRNLEKASSPFAKFCPKPSPVVFLFSGQGSQSIGMGKGLYITQSVYREHFDRCASLFQPLINHDLRKIIFATGSEREQNDQLLIKTEITQPALFAVEFALAKLWLSLGIVPDTLIGHSIGEYTAAAISGVFSLEDAVKLVAERGRLMQSMPKGSMVSVKTTEQEIQRLLPKRLQIAAINAPGFYVVSGPTKQVCEFTQQLTAENIQFTTLATSHAFHSQMMKKAATKFQSAFSGVALNPPLIPMVSTKTGARFSDKALQSTQYWCRQILDPVLFGDAVKNASKEPTTFLEIGPGAALTILSKASFSDSGSICINSSINGKDQEVDSWLKSVAKFWQLGYQVDWSGLYDKNSKPGRIPLPTYPFKPVRHWIDAVAQPSAVTPDPAIYTQSIQNLAVDFESPPPTAAEQSAGSNMSAKQLTIVELKTIFADLTGSSFDDTDDKTSFLELGLDSLLLTQIVLKLKNSYKLNIPFRQLMQDLESFDLLAEHIIDEAAPALLAVDSKQLETTTPVPVQAQEITATAHPTNKVATSIHQLLAHQLQLISQQIALLDRTGSTITAQPVPEKPISIPVDKKEPAATTKQAIDSTVAKKEKPFGAQTKIELRQQKVELSPEQQVFHNKLIDKYIKKTTASKNYTAKYRSILADPRSASGFTPELKEITYPIVVKRSKGCRLWDLDGNEYLDTLSGYGSNFFGYSPDFIVNAMKAQLDKGIEIGPQHPLAGEVAELLSELIPLDRFAFCNTGSEAVLGAIRMARTATGKNKIVMFKGGYHGINDEVIVRPLGKTGSLPAAAGITPEAVSNTIVLDYDDPNSLQLVEQQKDQIAAVLVEPVQSRNPKLQPQNFLKALRELTSKHEIALIMDEVITGFRLGVGGAQKYFGVKADIATYGKVIGGGVSIGIIGGCRKYLDTLDGGHWRYGDDSLPEVGVTYFAGTFVRHPLALAAAKAVLLNVKENGDRQARELSHKTEDFALDLNIFFKYQNVPLEIEYFASMMYLRFTREIPHGELLFCKMRTNGVHIWYGRPMFFTLAHTADDIDKIKGIFISSVLSMKKMGLLLPQAINKPVEKQTPDIASATTTEGAK